MPFKLIKDILLYRGKEPEGLISSGPEGVFDYHTIKQRAVFIREQIKHIHSGSENIGIFLPNSVQYIVAYFAITFADKVIVPVPVSAKKMEIQSTLLYCELEMAVTNSVYKVKLLDALQDFDKFIQIYNIDDHSIETMNPKRKHGLTHSAAGGSENNVAIMLHTSGTTSNPKRVMLTHKNLISNVRSNIQSLGFTQDDKTLIALPMFFGYCNTAQFLTHLYAGASIVIMDNFFLPKKFFETIAKEKITNFTGVPSMLLMLLDYKYRHKYDTSSLRYICFGGGNMPVEKLRQLIGLFPHTGFVQTYGQTEASPRVTALLPADAMRKIGSVGKAIPGVEVRIVDADGCDVKNGETGEIIVRGDNIMKGYYKRPDITETTIRNGWLYTGDLAKYDAEKYIYLAGRTKNIIISGGINIYPEEIEELLLNHAAVKEVRVFGTDHTILGEIPAAEIVLHEEFTGVVKETELMDYCVDNLAQYKVPSEIRFVKSLEKTKTGKIKRY